jgi:crotonobetainyl-CoA:carnitine CoA-transferase CaiB-like acyl-CoA transferase
LAGVLDGLKVLDLSWGISGPMATMLMADHGASVTRIEPPGGDPFGSFSGSRVWGRGKRSAVLDLKEGGDRDVFLRLASTADVVVESFAPGTTARLGIDAAALMASNRRLVYCTITAYGSTGKHSDRPGLDALVAARTGQQWEHRGVDGGTIERLSGGEGFLPGLEPPTDDCWVGPRRDGPLFGGVPWASVATGYLASLAISAALRVRERTGEGQHVETSLIQGVLATTVGAWQRAERFDRPGYQSWVIDPRAPKGFFRASDGRWTHHWVPLPSFVLGVAHGETLDIPPDDPKGWRVSAPKDAPMRVGVEPEEMIVLHAFHQAMKEAVARFPAADWARVAAQVGVPVQPVRSPEEALLDPDLLADGCVAEVDDPEVGPIRQVGHVYRLSACPTPPPRRRPRLGEHTDEIREEAAGERAVSGPPPPRRAEATGAPLSGIRVLDLGLAVAGPFGTQLLSDLGADVIKVNGARDGYWFGSHIAMCCNRGKRSIALDLKTTEGLAVLCRLVQSADIVQHNMRYEAAERLKVDYESLRRIKPDLIYCHTRGFERSWRDGLPGNDQTGAALAGTEWLDGGLDDGGKPIWSVLSLGDTGNGFLSAIGMVQALYHRDRTGEGQFVDTSILYAHLLNSSMAWVSPDGSRSSARPSLDAMQLGWNALYRLYETADGWLCLAAVTDGAWAALCRAVERPDMVTDGRFVDSHARGVNDQALADELHSIFGKRAAAEWFAVLDRLGVPCEISNPGFVESLFDDPEMIGKGWVTSYEQGLVGRMDVFGLLFDLSGSPGAVQGPCPVVGGDTREILREVGYCEAEIESLIEEKAAFIEARY